MSNKIIALVPDFTLIRTKTIYRGKSGKNLKIEFKAEEPPTAVKEKLVEAKPDGTVVFRKPGERAQTSSELIKDNKPPFKEHPTKPRANREVIK
jgi:hypothetical protein